MNKEKSEEDGQGKIKDLDIQLLTIIRAILAAGNKHQYFFFLFYFIYLFIYSFIYGCVGSSFLCEGFLQLRRAGATLHWCAGLSLSRPLLLRSTGSRRAGSVVVAHGPSCSTACGIFPDQSSNPCPLHWQADSQPLRHQGSPLFFFICLFLAASCLRCCVQPFSGCGERGPTLCYGAWASHCCGFSLLQTTSSRCMGFSSCDTWALESRLSSLAHRLSCSMECGFFLDQGSNLCPLHWQADS